MREADLLRSLESPVMVDGKVIKCSRVLLKQEIKVVGDQATSEVNLPTPSNQNPRQPAKPKDKRKQANLSKIDLTGQRLLSKDTYHNCTKNTKESSGDSSNDYNEYEADSMTNLHPFYPHVRESNSWDSPVEGSEGFFQHQYQAYQQPRTYSWSEQQQNVDQWCDYPEQTCYPEDQYSFG